MTKRNDEIKPETIYEHIWSAHGKDLLGKLDQSLKPRSSMMLYDIVKELEINPNSTALDVGCGRGTYSCQLAQRFGCHVIGLDPVMSNLEQARDLAAQGGLTQHVGFQQGVMEAIPFEDLSFDLVWCCDMLTHVRDLRQGMLECLRILKPAGAIIVYTIFATELMEAKEAVYLYECLGITPENMSSTYVEEVFKDVGLQILFSEFIGGEWAEYLEEHEGQCSKDLMRIARLLRTKEKIIAESGNIIYNVFLASCHWSIYQLMGKLSPAIYVCKKADRW